MGGGREAGGGRGGGSLERFQGLVGQGHQPVCSHSKLEVKIGSKGRGVVGS